MRKMMVILRGYPASGKSTLASKVRAQLPHNSVAVLSLDRLRETMWPVEAGLDGGYTLTNVTRDRRALRLMWDTTLISHLTLGQNIIVDNQNRKTNDVRKLTNLAARYGYDTLIVRMNVSLNMCIHNNRLRDGVNVVADDYMRKLTIEPIEGEILADYSTIDDVARTVAQKIVDVNLLNAPMVKGRTIVFGDVQSMGGPLERMLGKLNPTREDTLVFAGDLFDRGDNPHLVYEIITGQRPDLTGHAKIILVEGNHDENLKRILFNDPTVGARQFTSTRETLRTLHAHGVKNTTLRKLLKRFVPAYAFDTQATRVLVTHGGVSPATILTTGNKINLVACSLHSMKHGSSMRGDAYQGATTYDGVDLESLLTSGKVIQVHGHRNGRSHEAPVTTRGYVLNLEQGVEDGGYLACVVFQRTGNNTVLLGD